MRIKNCLYFIAAAALSCACCAPAVTEVGVIPEPNDVQIQDVLYPVGSDVRVLAGGLESEAEYAAKVLPAGAKGKVCLSLDSTLGAEEYVLKVRKGKVSIVGGSSAGVFYGIQTLLQEMESNDGCAYKGTIKDAPRFSWRGYMIDESRHFFGIDNVYKTLDNMARYKMNRFHWHLTDAPGWRIEIKSHPELTVIGSIGNHTDPTAAPAFFTQEQIKEVVEYAAKLHIDVVPEIDMPGHASSATRTYPQLGVGKEPGSFTYNPAKEEVYTFLEDVLKEVADLFPFEYIHIGGDEVFFGSDLWNEEKEVASLKEKEHLESNEDVERYFLKRISGVLGNLGRKMIAWDDVINLDVLDSIDAITWWRQERKDHIDQCLESGKEAILCPRLPLYLDFLQDTSHTTGRVWPDGSICTTESIYAYPETFFEVMDADVPKDNILGIQGNLWSEHVASKERVEYMTYPRICAIAESAWTQPYRKDYDSFLGRMDKEFSHFDAQGTYYYDLRDPEKNAEPKL